MTLSAADATAHLIENPFTPAWLDGHAVGVTLVLLAFLGAIFLRGFRRRSAWRSCWWSCTWRSTSWSSP